MRSRNGFQGPLNQEWLSPKAAGGEPRRGDEDPDAEFSAPGSWFLYYFLIKFFHQKGSAFGVTDSVILIKSRNLVSE